MGNQREIRQLKPTLRLGVAIPILDDCESIVSAIVHEHSQGHFYTYIAPANEERRIYNMDGPETELGRLRQTTFIIQSGGKMWCGYDTFRNHIENVAGFLNDATFLVGDENDYIDEFCIHDRKLSYRRLHSGFWIPIDAFLAEHYPDLSAADRRG